MKSLPKNLIEGVPKIFAEEILCLFGLRILIFCLRVLKLLCPGISVDDTRVSHQR